MDEQIGIARWTTRRGGERVAVVRAPSPWGRWVLTGAQLVRGLVVDSLGRVWPTVDTAGGVAAVPIADGRVAASYART